MTIPSQASIEVPLLIELERAGGVLNRSSDLPAFLDRLARHFPDLTTQDRQLRRATGSPPPTVWQNTVEWTRNRLCARGELNGGHRGMWAITDTGRVRLLTDLQRLGIVDAGVFIASSRSLPEVAGIAWRPESLRRRQRSPQTRRNLAPTPVVAVPIQPSVVQPSVQTSGAVGGQTRPAAAEHRGEDSIKLKLKARLQSLDPTQFERLVGEFLKAMGLADVQVTGRSGDGGIDGEATVPFLKLKCAFQAKRYATGNLVGGPAVRNFKGGVVGRYERGILITTSSFTEGAKEEAGQPGVTIVLIDGDQLVDELLKLGLGIKTIPVVERTLDEEFFGRLSR